MNTIYQIIKDFLSEKISIKIFFEQLYDNKEMQNELDKEIDIKPFTNEGSLLLYLMTIDPTKYEFIWDSKEALSKFLYKRGIKCEVENTEAKLYSVISESTPKWLNPPVEYLKDFVLENKNLKIKDIKMLIKNKILSDFIALKSYPKWLQSPHWPIENGKPLIFIGELDMSNLSHDTTEVYVFYNSVNKSFTNIKQSI